MLASDDGVYLDDFTIPFSRVGYDIGGRRSSLTLVAEGAFSTAKVADSFAITRAEKKYTTLEDTVTYMNYSGLDAAFFNVLPGDTVTHDSDSGVVDIAAGTFSGNTQTTQLRASI